MNLNREAAEADPVVAASDAADPAADVREVVVTEAVKAAAVTCQTKVKTSCPNES